MTPSHSGRWFEIMLYWFIAAMAGCWGWNVAGLVAHAVARAFASMG
jgi:hypothetical protein